MRWEQRKSDIELTCKVCPQDPPFPPPQKIPTGNYWVRICGEREDPICWDCYYELTND